MFTRNTRLGIILVILLAFAYIAIFFITQHHVQDEVVKIYFADRVTAAHKILINRYNQMMNGKVEVIPIDFPNFDFSTNERKEILARSLRGTGDGIDLFAVDVIWVQRFAKWCEPLDKYFNEKERARLLDEPLNSCYYKGELVAVPLDYVQGVMYYREDLLEKLSLNEEVKNKLQNGMSWDDFIKLGKSIGSANPFYIYPAADFEGLICVFMDLLLEQNVNYFRENGFNLNTPEANRALQLLVDLVNKYKLTPKVVTTFTEIPSYKYFIENDGYFIRGWHSYDKDFQENPIDVEKEKHLRKMQIPYFSDGKTAAVVGGWNLMMSKFSNKKKEVVDFIKYLLSDDAQELFYRESGYIPVIKNIYEEKKYLDKYPEILKLKKDLKFGVHRPAHEEYTRFSKIMSLYIEEAIKGNLSAKAALEKITHAIQIEETMIKEL